MARRKKSDPAPEDAIILYTTDTPPAGQAYVQGGMIYANSVQAGNLLRDIREILTNIVGGRMRRYENLVERALDNAFANLKRKALEQGYDAVVCVRVGTSTVTQGGAEIIVYGTGIHLKNP